MNNLRGCLSFLMPLLAPLLLGACPAPCEPPLGDPAAAPELVPAALEPGGALTPLAAQDPIDLLRPIQGGHVLFAGAFVRNVARCGGGSLRGELRREGGGRPGGLLYYDDRTVYLEPARPGEATPPGAGWGRPPLSIADVANVPACPNPLDAAFLDQPVWLQMIYTGPDGKTATASQQIVPRCRQPHPGEAALCRCECEANYTIERCQSRDGGL